MRKCILIKTNFEYEVVELPEDDTFNSEVYKLLDCECWEGVPGCYGTYLILDESGKIKSPPKKPNPLAFLLYSSAFLFNLDILCGDVLVSTIGYDSQGESNIVSLSDFQINRILNCLSLFKDEIKSDYEGNE